jgi:tetratricopeptide (TPR) repeat protein
MGKTRTALLGTAMGLALFWGCATAPAPEKKVEDRLDLKEQRAIDRLAGKIARERSEDFFLTGMQEFNKGDFKDAWKAFTRAVEEDPKDYRSYFFLGQTHEKMRDLEQAVNAYEKALEVRSHYLPAHEALGIVYYQQKNFSKAERHLREAEKLGSKSAEVFYYLGEIEQRKDDCEKAVAAYEQALKLNPDYVAAQNGLRVAQFTCRQKQKQEESKTQEAPSPQAPAPSQKSPKTAPKR